MTKPFDPIVKDLVETDPAAWPGFLGRRGGPVSVIDADVATVSTAADKVLRVAADPPYLLHLEFVTGKDAATLPRALHVRNALLDARHDLPVWSEVVLLRPASDSPQLTQTYRRACPGDEDHLTFRYGVTRVWRTPPSARRCEPPHPDLRGRGQGRRGDDDVRRGVGGAVEGGRRVAQAGVPHAPLAGVGVTTRLHLRPLKLRPSGAADDLIPRLAHSEKSQTTASKLFTSRALQG